MIHQMTVMTTLGFLFNDHHPDQWSIILMMSKLKKTMKLAENGSKLMQVHTQHHTVALGSAF